MTSTPQYPSTARSTGTRRCGFTLTEVLISVALVLLLILGINQVFSLTSRAVGAGQAVGDINRAARGAQAVITRDLTNADFDYGPFLWISSTTANAFRSKVDQAADADYSGAVTDSDKVDDAIATVDRDGSGDETNRAVSFTPRAMLTRRTHRADRMGFFTRTAGRTQTGATDSDTVFNSTATSEEQYVVYGHLNRPNSTAAADVGPGIGIAVSALTPQQSPDNFYAGNWILGRNVFQMREPDGTTTKVILDQRDIQRKPTPISTPLYYYGQTTVNPTGEPFVFGTKATKDGISTEPLRSIQDSDYDLIGMSMSRAKAAMGTYSTANPNDWFFGLAFHDVWPKDGKPNRDFRFAGTPIPQRSASQLLDRRGVARTVPCFVPNCTQFAVEFAGDFLVQSDDTTSEAAGSDGKIDFNYDAATQRRSIRWYGFPRDVNNDGAIVKGQDVVPYRDCVPGNVPAPFERILPTSATSPPPANYGKNNVNGSGIVTADPLLRNSTYYVVWGPDAATSASPRPKMIRVVMAIDDPAGRVGSEQMFEFVTQVQ